MKQVLVLGATGETGKIVVEQLKECTEVKQTIYVRNIGKLTEEVKETVQVLEGDVLDTDRLNKAMKNKDIVVACLNGELLPQAESIVKAMKSSDVKRVIWLTGLGIHHEVPGETGKMLDSYVSRFPEYVKAADTIVDSGVPYTLVRAAHLVDGDEMEYHLTKEGEEIRNEVVTKCAVAKFIYDMIVDCNELGKNDSIGITN